MSLLSLEDNLDVLVERLPPETRQLLALGPVAEGEGNYGCRVCNAMEATIDEDGPFVEVANMLLNYHDVDGSEGPRCYERCLRIYRAAGWLG